jgi:hypothetical protein
MVLWRAMTVFLAALVFSPFEQQLQAVGLSTLTLAVLFSFVVMFWFNIGRLAWLRTDIFTDRFLFGLLSIVIAGFFGTIVFLQSDSLIQHGVSVYYALWTVYLLILCCLGEEALAQSSLSFRDWPVGRVNAAQWLALSSFAQFLINAALVRSVTTTQWLVAFAVVPFVFHYLWRWSVIATHPYEDGS